MIKVRHINSYKRINIVIITLVMSLLPLNQLAVYAQTVDTTNPATVVEPAVETPPPPPKYVYNEETGLWDNGTYSWDPVTNKTTPLTEKNYSYNTDTNAWDTKDWQYDTDSKSYQPNTNVVVAPVEPSQTQSSLQPTTESSPETKQKIDSDNSGVSNLNAIDKNNNNSQYYSGFLNVNISGNINTTSVSGNASVLNNTIAGYAKTGDAFTSAMILNMINTVFGEGNSPAIYSANINGNYVGDLSIDPGGLAVKQSNTNINDLSVVSTNNLSIDNDINLLSVSGDAKVAKNTIAGNATTGDANALATIMNLINSSISANQSFVGVLNVLGNLEGDVLVPKDLMQTLIASNVPSSKINISNFEEKTLDVNINASTDITNNINARATSGTARVTGNTVGGNATTGDANTSITVFNLTGQSVIGQNALLVFVNVAGDWIGFITNAPAGATAAMLGTNSEVSNTNIEMAKYDINSDYTINNNINAESVSGNAEVSHNNTAGNATSGSAYTAVNTLNVVNSSFGFSGWFGALFINIFGDWHGSYGTDTAFGGFSTNTTQTTVGKGSGINVNVVPVSSTTDSPYVQPEVVVLTNNNGKFRYVASGFIGGSSSSIPPAQVASVADEAVVSGVANDVLPVLDTSAPGNIVTPFLIILLTAGGSYAIWRLHSYNQSQKIGI